MTAGLMALAVTAGCKTVTITAPGGGPSPPVPSVTQQDHIPGRADAFPAPVRTNAPPARPHTSKAAHRPPRHVLRKGSRGPRVRELQARLTQLRLFQRNPTGYYGSLTAAAVAALQRQQGLPCTGSLDRASWSALRALTRPPTYAELFPPTSRPVAEPDPRCLTGRVLCISKRSNTLAWMVDGQVRSAMDVRFGAQYTPTREGEFRIMFKSRRHVSTIYHTAMPYAMFFSGGQAVHFSADFAAHGYRGASHGCVNVRDQARIAALFRQVEKGDKVVIYK
ncbi:L,D-transpeptidase family protein [Streptomyces sp. NPDC007100]|uniref:L,D-transpeptidase family protein n=1 Tax=Streptomyces sp. NPDC007100 TaxID=3155602 RepID=UPI003407B464